MKICIIVFSPSGHTLHVATSMKQYFENHSSNVQLLDITGVEELHRYNQVTEYLAREVKPHDILCIGAPVYAGHFESTMLSLLGKIPTPNDTYGKYAIPFITFGGLHSGMALSEAGKLLSQRGRINISGLKVRAAHTLTATLADPIYPDAPNDEDEIIIKALADRVVELWSSGKSKDVLNSFDYAPANEKEICLTHTQDDFHHPFRNTNVDAEKCNGCGNCKTRCPVNMFDIVDGKAAVTNLISQCILCAECFHNCPTNAINYTYLEKAKPRFLNPVFELPASAVYP